MTAEAAAVAATPGIPFPSVAWFRKLADLMNANRARQEQLGYVDCTVGLSVTDAGPFAVRMVFEEFEATDVRELGPDDGPVDFVIEAPLTTWRAMIESIAVGAGRPALDQTLNHLTHLGEPMRVVAEDPLQRDLYFRYNQSLQELVNASAAFHTTFPG